MAALLAAAAEPRRHSPLVSLESEGVILDLRPRRTRRRSRQSAQGPPRRHRADQAAGDDLAAAQHRISGVQGHDPHRQGPSRRVRDYRRRFCAARPLLARRACIRAVAQRRAIALRSHTRPLRRHPAFPRGRPARWICARRRERSGRDAQGGSEGTRPRRHFRKTPLHCLHRRPVRAFALAHCRLHALPRSVPDRRNRPGRQPRGDRCPDLRRLRPVRRRMPHGRCLLCAAAGRCPHAQAAHAADGLSRSRRRAHRLCCCTTMRMARR